MSRRTPLRCLLGAAWAVSALVAAPAAALTFTFLRITDSTSAVPGGTGTFVGNFGGPSVDAGKVVFFGGVSTNAGIYSNASGSLQPVVKTGDPIPGGTGGFFVVDPQHFDGGVVPFRGNGSGGQLGIYSTSALGGGVTTVADLNTPVPGGTGNFPDLGGAADTSGGEYVIRSSVGFYRGMPGSLSVVADGSTAVPGGTGSFTSFGVATLDAGQVAFSASSSSGSGLYSTGSGGLQLVANTSTAIPGGLGTFTILGSPVVDGGIILFRGAGTNNQFGLYASSSGGLSVIADVFTASPSGAGNFTNFGLVYAIESGAVAFTATDFSQTNALYSNLGGTLMRVIGAGDSLDGKTVSDVVIGFDAIDGNTIAFKATFTDGSSGIFTAVPEPATLLLLALAGGALGANRWRGSRRPGRRLDARMDEGRRSA